MKGLLLRIAIDKGSGGCLGPISPDDDSFEYIPIPEKHRTSEKRTYKDIIRKGRPLSDFVPKRLHDSIPHLDPEFETFTYGDPTSKKSRQLIRLSKDDLLIFYAGLNSIDGTNKKGLYAIGYFTVQHVYNFSEMSESERITISNNLSNNAHTKRLPMEKELVIVKGNPNTSKLLPYALPIGDKNHKIFDNLKSTFGYSGDLRRAIGHWINEPYIHGVITWLGYHKK